MRISLLQPSTFVTLAMLAAFAIGCATTTNNAAKSSEAKPRPQKLSLDLRAGTTDGRYTYFEVTDDGELKFGGGRAGAMRKAARVAVLTPEQRDAIWQIIAKHDLIHAKNSKMFARAEKVTYDLDISTGGPNHSLRAIDDEVPAVKELHDHLFDLQANVRYTLPAIQAPVQKAVPQ